MSRSARATCAGAERDRVGSAPTTHLSHGGVFLTRSARARSSRPAHVLAGEDGDQGNPLLSPKRQVEHRAPSPRSLSSHKTRHGRRRARRGEDAALKGHPYAFAAFLAKFLVLFVASDVRNGSTFRMVPVIFGARPSSRRQPVARR